MKLLFVITGLSTGGAETMLYKLLCGLDRSTYQAYVISLTNSGEFGPKIAALGIPVWSLNMEPGFPNPIKFVELVSTIKKIEPDLVHTWMYHADLLGGLAAKIAGVRSIAWCLRNSGLAGSGSKLTTRITLKLCAIFSWWIPNIIISCSLRAVESHVEAGYCRSKFDVIPNGFDLKAFRPNLAARDSFRAELSVPVNSRLVGLIGRYHPQKNHSGFLLAARHIAQQCPNSHFVMVGGGVSDDNVELKKLIDNYGLEGRVHMLGLRTDIPHVMAALDVLVSASIFGEAFPNVLGEAMACGIPCVVTDVGDSAEIVGDSGRVVAVGDIQGLAENVEDILRMSFEDFKALGLRGRDRACEKFDISKVVQRYQQAYKNLVKGCISNAEDEK